MASEEDARGRRREHEVTCTHRARPTTRPAFDSTRCLTRLLTPDGEQKKIESALCCYVYLQLVNETMGLVIRCESPPPPVVILGRHIRSQHHTSPSTRLADTYILQTSLRQRAQVETRRHAVSESSLSAPVDQWCLHEPRGTGCSCAHKHTGTRPGHVTLKVTGRGCHTHMPLSD
jgi:hypothetical protein